MKQWLMLAALGCAAGPSKSESDSSSDTSDTLGCPVTLTHSAVNEPDEVWLAVDIPGWRPEDHPLAQGDDGTWTIDARLDPGAYAYRFIEFAAWTEGGAEISLCDASAPLAVCANPTTWENDWAQDCTTDGGDCDSMVVVDDCSQPRVTVQEVVHADGSITVTGEVSPASAMIAATLNGASTSVRRDGALFHVEHSGLDEGRHQIDVTATGENGAESELTSIPVWTDDWDWDEAVIYHAMIDRVQNGDPSNDAISESSHTISDWAGGDLAGLQSALPFLDDLGVNTIWLSNPQPAPEGAWPGTCDATYAGFHGFWPTAAEGVDARLGTVEELDALIAEAHARHMRVIVDWVGNHIHSENPDAADAERFHPLAECNGTASDGGSNWDRIPEDCWFTSYLPDWDHSQPEVMDSVIQTAVDWARERKLDGLRVDAAKHMSHAVLFNLRSRLSGALEHPGSGFDFNLVGETFDGAEAINRYIGPHLLHGQFDFPLYWAIRDTFAYDSRSVADTVWQAANIAQAYPEGRMSTFLGNLDVSRFVSDASEAWDGVCGEGDLRQAGVPAGMWAYQRLALAWTVLFTQPGMPMIYYGDEFGLPGYGDPDNRQPLSWHGIDLAQPYDGVMASLSEGPAHVLNTVSRLAQARAIHAALREGERMEWWNGGDGLYATAHVSGDSEAIVVINRTDSEQWLDNGIAFAGLTSPRWSNILSDQSMSSDGDRLVFSIPPNTAQVWVGVQ